MPGTLIDVINVRIAPGVPATRLPLASEWIAISNRCRASDINRGRDHELSRTQAGTATIVLDDRDRALDPDNAAGPYYPDLQPMMWIELAYDSTVKFTGYVERFDVSWPGGPYPATRGDAIVTISAVDVFKLASLGDLVSYPSTVLGDGPVAYWRLNEPSGLAINIGSQQDAGVVGEFFNLKPTPGAVLLGSMGGPLGNNKTVADFSGTPNVWPLYQNLIRNASSSAGPAPAWSSAQVYQVGARVSYQGNIYVAKLTNQGYPPFDSPAVWTWVPTDLSATGTIWHPSAFEMWLDPRTLIVDTGIAGLYEYTSFGGVPMAIPWRIAIDTGGSLRMEWSSAGSGGFAGATVRTTPSPANLLLANGGWQHIVAVIDGSIVQWYRNGEFFGSSNAPVASGSQEYNLNLAVLVLGANNNPGIGYDGRMSHFALFPNKLTPSRIIAHYTSTADTVDEALSGSQIESLLDALLIPSNMRDIDPGASTMQSFEPSGSALDQLLHIAEDTERGIFIASPEGKFKFIDRNTLFAQGDAVATFGDAGTLINTGDGYGVAKYGVGQYEDFIVTSTEIGYRDLVLTEADEDLKTLVSVTRQNGTEQVAWDQATSIQKGVRTLSLSGLSFLSDEDASALAGFLLARFHLSQQRPQQMTIIGSDSVKKAQIAARDVGDRIAVVRRPPGGGAAIMVDVTIEGLQHSWAVGRPWETTYREDLPPDTGAWRIGTSELDVDTTLGWGEPEPEGTEWIDNPTFVDGDTMSLKEFSVLMRRDPALPGKAHACRFYRPQSFIQPPISLGTPEIQRIKYRSNGATSGTFNLIRPATGQGVQVAFNVDPVTLTSQLFRTIPRGGGTVFYGTNDGAVTQSRLQVPLNHGGLDIVLGWSGGTPVTSAGVDSSGLTGDALLATVTQGQFSQTHIVVKAVNNALSGGTWQLIVEGVATDPIPWNVDEIILKPIVEAIVEQTTVDIVVIQPAAGLKDGYDITIVALGDQPQILVDNALLVGDVVDVIPVQDGDLTFTSLPLLHGDSYGRFFNTDAFGYPMQLGKLPGRWWLHGQVGYAGPFGGKTSAVIRRNGVEHLSDGCSGWPVQAGYINHARVTTEVQIVAGDYIELGVTDPTTVGSIYAGTEHTYLEAVWMGD